MELSTEHKETLLSLAITAIEYGIINNSLLSIDPREFGRELRRKRAAFVTLKQNGQLRGCIGSIKATQPLATEVVERAYAAAFRDPRFDPLSSDEFDQTKINISVLSKPQKIRFSSERDFLQKLQPGVDGVIIKEENTSAVFLPVMWEEIPTTREFISELKKKAGLPADYWSSSMQAFRFTTNSF